MRGDVACMYLRRDKLNPQELEAFKRGIILSFISMTVRGSIHKAFMETPDPEGVRGDANEIASRIIITVFKRLNIPTPTMEEAVVNLDVIREVGDVLTTMKISEQDFLARKHRSSSSNNTNASSFSSLPPNRYSPFKREVHKQRTRKEEEDYDPEESRKAGLFDLSRKERESLK